MRVSRLLLVPGLAFAFSSVHAQSAYVNSPFNVLQNGGFETTNPDDRIIPGWNLDIRPWSAGVGLSSPGNSSFGPRAGAGAAYMTVSGAPSAAVLYQQFTIAPIPVRNCQSFLGDPRCSRLEFSFGARDHSHLFFNAADGAVDPRRNMTSLENYPGYAGNGPPPDYRDFPTQPPCIPTGYNDEFGNPICEIGPLSEFWYGTPNANTRQFFTVDLLRGGADPFSIDANDVLMTFFRGASGWQEDFYGNPSIYPLDPILRDGGTFMLRFGVAANLYNFDVMVDEVALVVYNEPLPTPEPGSLSLLALGLGAFGLVRVRRKS